MSFQEAKRRMEFGIGKSAMLVIEKGKIVKSVVI